MFPAASFLLGAAAPVLALMTRTQPTPPALSSHHRAKLRHAVRRRRVEQLDFFRAPRTPRPCDAQRLTQIAMGVWRASGPVEGTAGEGFFRSRRLAVPGPEVVRFHPNLTFGKERAAGLIWLLRDQRTDEPCGCVRVFVDEFGWPIGRRVLGRRDGATLNRAPRPP
jgi:hypothetical protein